MSFKFFSEFSFFFFTAVFFSVLFYLCVHLFFIYNFILQIENLFRLTNLTFKDYNYSLPRNLASTTKFYWFICEKSELFILSDSLALSDLLQTLTESANLIMDQRVNIIFNIEDDYCSYVHSGQYWFYLILGIWILTFTLSLLWASFTY